MRICVLTGGRELEGDLVVRSGRLDLYLRIDPGHTGDPPRGTFSVERGLAVGPHQASGEFPRLSVVARPGRKCTISFVSEPQTDGALVRETRELKFIHPWHARWMATAVLTATVASLFAMWQFGIALQSGRSEVDSLWAADTILSWGAPLAGVTAGLVGVTTSRARNYFLARVPLTAGLAVGVSALATTLPIAFLGTVTNATPETIAPFDGVATALGPAKTTRYLRGPTKLKVDAPFEVCALSESCPGTDLSLTSLLIGAFDRNIKVVRCARRQNEKHFEEDLARATTCTPDADHAIHRTAAEVDFLEAKDKVSSDIRVRYEFKPFAPTKQAIEKLAERTVTVRLAEKHVSAYSDIVLEGHDIVSKVHLPLPTDGITALGPWTSGATLMNGRVLSGTTQVGSVSCVVPHDTAHLRIAFEPTRAHLKRVVVTHITEAGTENGNFYQSFEIDRPELVTHVPWCLSPVGEQDAFALDLHLDGTWTPRGWSMVLPVGVSVVHVFRSDGALLGRLLTDSGNPLKHPTTLVAHSLGANVRVFAAPNYYWAAEAAASSSHPAVWAIEGDERFNVQLDSGEQKVASPGDSPGNFKLTSLQLRRCFINTQTNRQLQEPMGTCVEDERKVALWFSEFPHVGCSTRSQLCTP